MDVLTLRQGIETALAGYLGTYTLPNGSTTPAISVRAQGEALQAGTTVTGIEVIIRRDAGLRPARQYQGEQAFPEWTVFLVDWDSTGDLTGAATTLIATYPGSDATTPVVPEGVGPKAQRRFVIRTSRSIVP